MNKTFTVDKKKIQAQMRRFIVKKRRRVFVGKPNSSRRALWRRFAVRSNGGCAAFRTKSNPSL